MMSVSELSVYLNSRPTRDRNLHIVQFAVTGLYVIYPSCNKKHIYRCDTRSPDGL